MVGTLGHLAATVSLDIDPFKASARTLSSTIKATTAELKAQDAAFKGSSQTISGMKNAYSTLSRQSKNYEAQLATQAAKYKELANAAAKADGDTEKLTARQANAAAAYNKTAAQMSAVNTRMTALRKEIMLQESGWTKASAGAAKFSTVTGKVGTTLSNFGSKANMGITVPLVTAFAAATKKAIAFQSTMTENKNLLQTGARNAKEYASATGEVATMSKDAVNYSNHYGVSVQKIANGYQDLIKRGYTGKQAIGAMKSELQASVASGDDFNDVVNVASQTLESFGMKADTTAGMTRNTKEVVNDLAYAADLTSTKFSDLGVGMSYVGSSAHQAGFSLSETASAMGILSNNGLEADKAGTGLRKVIVSLSNSVKGMGSGNNVLDKLGIKKNEMVDANGNLRSMSDIFGVINKHTKDMNGTEKAALFNSLFGTTGQQAGFILADNAKQLEKLNAEVAKSSKNDYVGKLSEKNLKTAANQLKIFKESVENLGMSLAQNLLPTITPIINKASQLAQKFGELDSGTQRNIVKWGLLAAAIGPASTLMGGAFKIMSGGAGIFSTVAAGMGRATTAAKLGATGMDVLKAAFSKTGFEAVGTTKNIAGVGTVLGESATGSKLFSAAVDTTNVALSKAELRHMSLSKAIRVSGASATETTAAWRGAQGGVTLFGKALTTSAGEVGVLGTALTPLGAGLAATAVAVGAGVAIWELWGKKAYESGQRTQEWGSDIGAAAAKSAGAMKSASGEISGALDNTNSSTKANVKAINDGFASMTAAAKKAASESESAARRLAKSLGGNAAEALTQAAAKEKAANDKRISQMEQNAKQAEQITRNSNKTGQQLTSDQIQVLENLRQSSAAQAVKTLNLSGKQENNVLKAILGEKTTMSKAAADKQYEDMQYALQKEYRANTEAQNKIKNSAKLSTAEKNAALEGLEQDHQAKLDTIYTGAIQAMKAQGDSRKEILSNLESAFDLTADEANSAMNSYEKAMSKGVNSNKQFAASVTDGMSASVKKAGNDWNSLVLDPKTGKVVTNLNQVLKDTANTKDGWNRLNFDLKNAKISTNAKQAIVDALAASDKWNTLPYYEKDAIIRTQGRTELADVMDKFATWDSFSLKDQQAIVHGDYTALVAALVKSGDWNNMSLKEKQAVVHDKATTPIVDALVQTGKWNGLSVQAKSAIVNAKGKADLADLVVKYGLWGQLPEKTKNLLINDADARAKLVSAGVVLDTYNAKPVATKVFKVDVTSATGNSQKGQQAIDAYNAKHPLTKNLNGNPIGIQNASKASITAQNAHNNKQDKTKNLNGNASNIKNASNQSVAAQNAHNNKSDKTKNLNGNASGMKNASSQSLSAQNAHNNKTVNTKQLRGNSSSVTSASSTSISAIGRWNGYGAHSKSLKASNQAAAAAAAGVSAILSWNSHNPVVHIFKTIYQTVNGKKATGDPDFDGGLATVNDAPGSMYREAITLPTGETFIPSGRNVTMALPKHTKIQTAMTTAAHYNIPRFASGTGDFTGAANHINNLMPQPVQVSPISRNDSTTQAFDPSGIIANQQAQISIFQQQNVILGKMVELLSAQNTDSNTGQAVRQLLQQVNTVNGQIERGRLS
ncbi:phage tail tape measure protein [Loigolactobacillus bifermentans]|uniref:TP901 family phage tail tape measure protein n=1 Tax=Loigolactobacillus bifermentans DSM 20003 TaxID=1423726 RepID=A0A0R1HB47_9LACO|nr:phage tail tape measure protein [Loigolactobacillus bifermentans]KRK40890.1 TP901 family phage tail tape measure protein [Loigolactobacillus bifermentans DSM 20003]QGG59643.1 phage tail tape measure protein [Loigolactobacillus bifermentans]